MRAGEGLLHHQQLLGLSAWQRHRSGGPELPCDPSHLPSVHDMGSFISRPVLIFRTILNQATNGLEQVAAEAQPGFHPEYGQDAGLQLLRGQGLREVPAGDADAVPSLFTPRGAVHVLLLRLALW